jgi:competence protein ComEC
MGDVLAIQERDLMDLGDPGDRPRPRPHRLLKVGHHGSRNASDPAWVAALRPEVTVIPAGLRNRFEHPHPETLDTLRQAGTAWWITGPSAGVRLSAVPAGWGIETGDGAVAFTPLRRSPTP